MHFIIVILNLHSLFGVINRHEKSKLDGNSSYTWTTFTFLLEKQFSQECLSEYVKITKKVFSATFFLHYPNNNSVFAICNKIKYFIQFKMEEMPSSLIYT